MDKKERRTAKICHFFIYEQRVYKTCIFLSLITRTITIGTGFAKVVEGEVRVRFSGRLGAVCPPPLYPAKQGLSLKFDFLASTQYFDRKPKTLVGGTFPLAIQRVFPY